MPDSCCAYGCTNRREENGDGAFYRFPPGKKGEKEELRQKWIQACQRENWSEQQIGNTRICEIISLQVSTMAWYIPLKFLIGVLCIYLSRSR